MATSKWRGAAAQFWAFLKFGGRLPDKTRKGVDKIAWKRELRASLAGRSDETLDGFTEIWRRRYEDGEATRGSVATRGNSLLLFVGVLTTGASLVVSSLVGAPFPLLIAIAVVGGALLYCAVAAAVLAVRAQLVRQWDIPRVDIRDATDSRAVKLTYAVEVYVAAEENQVRLRNPVGLLRDGQLYAVGGVFLIAALAVLAVTTAALRPDASRGQLQPSPSPSAPITSSPSASVPGASPAASSSSGPQASLPVVPTP